MNNKFASDKSMSKFKKGPSENRDPKINQIYSLTQKSVDMDSQKQTGFQSHYHNVLLK